MCFALLQFFIVLSCLISVSVNFSTFLVIGKTSPVTYQVLGHLKTCLVLAFGYVLLHDPFSWRNILGILIAVVGMVLYSYCCTLESQQKANEASAPSTQVVQLLSMHNFYILMVSHQFRFSFSETIRKQPDLSSESPPPTPLSLYLLPLTLNSISNLLFYFCSCIS